MTNVSTCSCCSLFYVTFLVLAQRGNSLLLPEKTYLEVAGYQREIACHLEKAAQWTVGGKNREMTAFTHHPWLHLHSGEDRESL